MKTEADRERDRAYARSWREKNREKLRAYYEEYRAENRATINASQKSYEERNRESLLEKGRAWREENKTRVRESQRRYYMKNKKVCYERNRRLCELNPDQTRAYQQTRRARVRGAKGKYSAADVAEIREMQRNRCAICRVDLSRVKEHIDHIMPLALGGSNDRTNIQVLCEPCNLQKWAHHPLDHARMRGLLL